MKKNTPKVYLAIRIILFTSIIFANSVHSDVAYAGFWNILKSINIESESSNTSEGSYNRYAKHTNPTVENYYYLDACLERDQQCGLPVAKEFCSSENVVEFQMTTEYEPILPDRAITKSLNGNHECSLGPCQRMSEITCGTRKSFNHSSN